MLILLAYTFRNHHLFLILITGCLSACGRKEKINSVFRHVSNADLPTISIETPEKLHLDEIVDTTFFIPLETRTNVLIGEIKKVLEFNDKLFVFDKKKANTIFVFNKTGRFLYTVGKRGGGPGEYNFIVDFYIDARHKKVVLVDQGHLSFLEYSTENGQYIRNSPFDFNFRIGVHELTNYNNKIFVYSGNNEYNPTHSTITALDTAGNTTGALLPFSEKEETTLSQKISLWASPEGIYTAQLFNDTIYNIRQNNLIPVLHIDAGKYAWQEEFFKLDKTDPSFLFKTAEYWSGPQAIVSSNNEIYLYGGLNKEVVSILFFKNTGKSFVFKSFDSDKFNTLPQPGIVGVVNGMLCFALYSDSILGLKEFLEEVRSVNEQHHKRFPYDGLYEQLKNVNESSNPYLVVIKFKNL